MVEGESRFATFVAIETLGWRRIHTPWAVAGGVRDPLDPEKREYLRNWIPEARETCGLALETMKTVHARHEESINAFGTFRSLFVGLVSRDGALEYYGGCLRITDSGGNVLHDHVDPRRYSDYSAEATEPWSYLKFPYYRPYVYPRGMYRVGPLARVNICDYIETPLAEAERKLSKQLAGEAGIRMFDPCLSCSTHAVGQLPLHVQLVRADGSLIHEWQR